MVVWLAEIINWEKYSITSIAKHIQQPDKEQFIYSDCFWISDIPDRVDRPECHICKKNIAPLSCTAFTIGFQASTCSCVKIPGVSGYLHPNKHYLG